MELWLALDYARGLLRTSSALPEGERQYRARKVLATRTRVGEDAPTHQGTFRRRAGAQRNENAVLTDAFIITPP
ncbi:MAG: hypothetical protein MUQ10_09765 [Anaerolineae bacterium]|nr:hypothetical protein [Anaerolineae bacterium]